MNEHVFYVLIFMIIAIFGGVIIAYAEPIEERVQQFIHDREIHQYEPIEIRHWSFSGKTWVNWTINGDNYQEIQILQNERTNSLLEYQICQDISLRGLLIGSPDRARSTVINNCGEVP